MLHALSSVGRFGARLALAFVAILAMTAYAHAENHGAIAYSPTTGASGWSYDYGNRRGAEDRALKNCNQHAGDCQVVVWFHNMCGAVAVDMGNNGVYGYAWADSRQGAERGALDRCAKLGRTCKINTWSCTSRGSASTPGSSAAAPSYTAPQTPTYTPPKYTCPPGYLVNGHQCY